MIHFYRSLLLFLLCLSSQASMAVTLHLVYEDKSQPPYYLGDSAKVLSYQPGIAVEMLQSLGERIDGLEIKLSRMPWKRALYSLKSNRIDGIFNASYKPERLDFGWYPTTNAKLDGPVDISRRITTISYSLYQLKDQPINWTGQWPDLKDTLVGAPLGYSIVSDLKKQGIRVEESNSTHSNLSMLINHRLNVVALQTITGDSHLATHHHDARYQMIEKLYPPLVSKPYYLMLSHAFVAKNPKMAQRIWDEIKYIREQDTDSLYQAYQE